MKNIENIIESEFYQEHGKLLCSSFHRLTGQLLLPHANEHECLIRQLYNAPFALLSHGVEEDPIFNFGNQKAMEYFEIEWDALLQMPSRLSAEPQKQEERARSIAAINEKGYIDNYSSIRISAKGNRFIIDKAIVWHILDEDNIYRGLAAMFKGILPCE